MITLRALALFNLAGVASLNPLDWLLAAILLYSIVRAILRGFILEAFALGGAVFGFLFACWFYEGLADRLSGLIAKPQLAQLVAFLLIVAAVTIAAALAGKFMRRTVSAIGLGFFDRLLGALFGALRGAILGAILLLSVTAFLPTGQWIETSSLAPYFLRAVHAVSFIMPSDLKDKLLDGLDKIKHNTPRWIKPELSVHTDK